MKKYKGRDNTVFALRLPYEYRKFLIRGPSPDGRKFPVAQKAKIYLSMIHSLYLLMDTAGDMLSLNQAFKQAMRTNMIYRWADPYGPDEDGNQEEPPEDHQATVAIRLTPIFRRFLTHGHMITAPRDLPITKKCKIYLTMMRAIFGLREDLGEELTLRQALEQAEVANVLHYWTGVKDDDEEAFLDRELAAIEREELGETDDKH